MQKRKSRRETGLYIKTGECTKQEQTEEKATKHSQKQLSQTSKETTKKYESLSNKCTRINENKASGSREITHRGQRHSVPNRNGENLVIKKKKTRKINSDVQKKSVMQAKAVQCKNRNVLDLRQSQ